MIQYDKDGQEIIKRFDKLAPWEKGELIKYLTDKCMDWDEVEKYFIEGSGYVEYNTIDNVHEVIMNNQEDEVLDSMDEMEICDYLIAGYNGASNLKYILERVHQDDIAEAFSDLDSYFLNPFLDSMKDNYKDKLIEIKEYIDTILKEDE